jgi:hypothetical protein
VSTIAAETNRMGLTSSALGRLALTGFDTVQRILFVGPGPLWKGYESSQSSAVRTAYRSRLMLDQC